jgi:GT2 family glycosyltransferase
MSTPPRSPDVTLSIVSFGTRDLLRACLRSIGALDPSITIQTVVVDNGSTDGSPEMVASEFSWVELIRNSRNRYFAAAHNQAFALARGRYVGILNSDTVLYPDTIAKMVAFMDARPGAGASTCRYLRDDGTELKAEAHNHWRFRSLLYVCLCRNQAGEQLFHLLGGKPSAPISANGDVIETDVVSDTFLFVRKDVLDRIHGYDERFRLYCTEDDICASVKAAGYQVFYNGGAKLTHSLSQSVRRVSPLWIRWIYALDSMRYFSKRARGPNRWLARPLLIGAYFIDVSVIAWRSGRWK